MKTKQFRWLAATLMLVAAMVMPSVAWAQNTITPSKPSGEGTAESPYQIGTAEELYWFAGLVNGDASVCDYNADTNPDGTQQNTYAWAVLTANITVNSQVLKADGSIADDVSGFISWTPIGNSDNKYTGTFDGKGYTVSGLYFNDSSIDYVGFFGYSCGTIQNVGVVDSYFNGGCNIGGVCGQNEGGTIQSCHNSSTIYGTNNAGGVCGLNYAEVISESSTTSTIINCYNTGSVSVNGTGKFYPFIYSGGVCGRNSAFVDVSGTAIVIIKNCFNSGSVSGSGAEYNNYVGGVCGENTCYIDLAGSVTASITNCYNNSDIFTGNVVGDNNDGTVDENVEGKTRAQFNSGEVAYLLNEGKAFGTQVWGQQLGVNDYPVLGSDYKVIRAARGDMDANGDYPYWATFSNQSGDSNLGDLNVYTAKVSNGILTITRCSDKIVAVNEGVLVKGNAEYLNAKMLNTTSANAEGNNDLVATPDETEVIYADPDHKLYRLTYNTVSTEEALGFYWGMLIEDDQVRSDDGSQLKATPNKAYLDVTTAAATGPFSAAPARGFAFPGDGETTGIECISVTDDSLHKNGNAEGIFDLQGRKVSKPTKGVYINNGKKVIIK